MVERDAMVMRPWVKETQTGFFLSLSVVLNKKIDLAKIARIPAIQEMDVHVK